MLWPHGRLPAGMGAGNVAQSVGKVQRLNVGSMEGARQTYTAEGGLGDVEHPTEPRAHGTSAQTTWGPVVARSKFLWRGQEKLYVCGTTYGTFGPGEDGSGYPAQEIVEADFDGMAAVRLN